MQYGNHREALRVVGTWMLDVVARSLWIDFPGPTGKEVRQANDTQTRLPRNPRVRRGPTSIPVAHAAHESSRYFFAFGELPSSSPPTNEATQKNSEHGALNSDFSMSAGMLSLWRDGLWYLACLRTFRFHVGSGSRDEKWLHPYRQTAAGYLSSFKTHYISRPRARIPYAEQITGNVIETSTFVMIFLLPYFI